MALITRPHSYTAGSIAKSADANSNENTIYSEFNGQIDNINLSAAAAIDLSKLASLTSGSIPYVNSSGKLTEINTKLYWDATNSRLGINTNAPTTALHVVGNGTISGDLTLGGSITLGTITSGVWNSTAIGTQYGGTGQNFSASTGLIQVSSGTASVITTSAALATIISDETGSGALVFGTSPTLSAPVFSGTITGTYTLGGSPTLTTSTFTTSVTSPIVYGGTAVGSTVNIKGTSNGSPSNAHIFLNSAVEGFVSINTTLHDSNLHIGGKGVTVGGAKAQLVVDDDTSSNVDVGGGIIFDGYAAGTSTKADFGAIAGMKENSIGGNTAGRLGFFTQANGGTLTERAQINSIGRFVFSNSNTGPLLQFPAADMQILMGGTIDPGWAVPAIQLNQSSLYSINNAGGIASAFNTYYDGANFRYIASATATAITQDGNIRLATAGPGTAGNIISFTNILVLTNQGGVQIGSPTGGDQGVGTLNVSSNIYKNGSAYNNPDYVFEKAFTGKIVRFANREGAALYTGLLPLDEVETQSRQYNTLPLIQATRIRTKGRVGLFDGGDAVLASLEEAYLYLFQLNTRITSLEKAIKRAA